jgi:sulfur transfer protein SufE
MIYALSLQVWVTASVDSQGRLVLGGGSDSELSAGVVAVLTQALSGLTPQELLQVRDTTGGSLFVSMASASCCRKGGRVDGAAGRGKSGGPLV